MAELKLYNTLTGGKEIFKPLDPANVRLYVCGPTVYDFAHIGNARPLIVFDVLFRLLRHVYGKSNVTYVRNITDVDDKINARAKERGISIRELTDGTLKQFHQDVDGLQCLRPTHEPRATDYIAANVDHVSMIGLIKTLIERGHAYKAEGHVLFDVSSMPDYGKLSNRSMDEMMAGARVEVAPFKKNPADFVLWKPSSSDQPGWTSPWGRGRPGWHIECSAMSAALLGKEFDIHGGGIDLIFPHHENEIAQSCCAFGTKRMAQIFMHNGFLQMEGEKMSKSSGNFATIREVLNEWPADVVRLTTLKTHYRQPIDWTVHGLKESEKTLDAWHARAGDEAPFSLAEDFIGALADDLNTPLAISVLHQLDGSALRASANLLGLMQQEAGEWREARQKATNINPAAIEALLKDRQQAREAKDWVESDRIRDELAEMRIAIKDSKDGTTTWEVM